MKILKKRNPKIYSTILLFVMVAISTVNLFEIGLASESVSVRVIRRSGADFGVKINGDLTIKGSGSDGIVRMELYFNETLVASSASNSLSYNFNTDDYPEGSYIILLRGWDSTGAEFNDHENKTFFYWSDAQEIGFFVGILAIVIIAIAVKYIGQKRNQKDKSKPLQKDIVQIDEL